MNVSDPSELGGRRHDPGRRLLRSALSAILLLLALGRASAQDVLLSPDSDEGVLPASAQIQAAATQDELTLVAWGSTFRDSSGRVHNCLYAQFLRDSVPVGTPMRITGEESYPSGFVQVLARPDRFLVAWAEQTGGAKLVEVDTAGNVGPVRLLDEDGWFTSPGILTLQLGDREKLIWTDSLYLRILARMRDRATGVLGPLEELGTGTVVELASYPAIPGVTLIDRGNASPLLCDPLGRVTTIRDSAARKFAGTFWIGPDGSVVATRAKDVQVFASLLDSVPQRTVALPPGPAAWPGTAVAMIDTNRRLRIWYVKLRTSFRYYVDAEVESAHQRLREVAPDSFAVETEIVLGSWWTSSLHLTSVSATTGEARILRGCGGRYLLRCRYQIHILGSYNGSPIDEVSTSTVVAKFDVDGPLDSNASYLSCGSGDGTGLVRLSSKSASTIAASRSGRIDTLRAPAIMPAANLPDARPVLSVVGEDLRVAWVRTGQDTTAFVGRWSELSRGILPVDGALSQDAGPSQPAWRKAFRERWEMGRGDGALTNTWFGRWYGPAGPELDTQYVRIHVPVGSGWKAAIESLVSDTSRLETPMGAVYDPVARESLILLGRVSMTSVGANSRAHVVALDAIGDVSWRTSDSIELEPQTEYPALIPLRPREYLLLTSTSANRFSGDALVWSRPLEPMSGARYVSLGNGSALRWHIGNGRKIEGEIIDSEGTVIRRDSGISLIDGDWTVAAAASHANGYVAYVLAGLGGVLVTTVDPAGRILSYNDWLSHGAWRAGDPVAVIRNDSLFAAWVDTRRGTTDIYGTAVPLSRLARIDGGRTWPTAPPHLSIRPTPACGRTTVWIDAPVAAARLRIVDVLGRTVLEQEVREGTQRVDIDVMAMPAGPYRVSVDADGRERSGWMIVR